MPGTVPDILLPSPHPRQREILDSPCRFKLVRAGRRFGKSRFALIRAVIGDAASKGMAAGGEWAWVAPDYPQSRAIWREEILPRFAGKDHLGVTVSETDKRVVLPGGGSLELRSAENVDSLRGRALDGIIFDEAAHLDLAYAWEQVARPALLDRTGSALFISSPNGGLDGNPEHKIPSYFNRLCARVMAGELGPEWGHWHCTTRDNPYLPLETVAQEYRDATDLARRQELDAELVLGGGGQAFPEYGEPHRVNLDTRLLGDWAWYAGLDWGYRDAAVLTLFAVSPGADVHVYRDWSFEGKDALLAGQEVGEALQDAAFAPYPPSLITYDSAMGAVTGGGETVLERFQRGFYGRWPRGCAMAPASKGPGSIRARIDGLHGLLRVPEGRDRPGITFGPEARTLDRTLPLLMLDPKDQGRLADGQADHAFDSLTYGLQARPMAPRVVEERRPYQNVSVWSGEGRGRQRVLGVPLAEVVETRGAGKRFRGRSKGQRMAVEG